MLLASRTHRSLIAALCVAVLVLPGCSDGPPNGSGSTGGTGGKAAGASGSSSQVGGGGSSAGMRASGGTASGAGGSTGGMAGKQGGTSGSSSQVGGGGSGSGMGASGGTASGGSSGGGSSGQASGGAGGAAPPPSGFAVRTDTSRDGSIDDEDTAGFTDWAWKGSGAFFLANTDDDDEKGEVDVSDEIVNGLSDEADLARIAVEVSPELLTKAAEVSVSIVMGAERIRLFEKRDSGWTLVNGALSKVAARIELGVEATQFADEDWDGFTLIKVDVLDASSASLASQQVKMRVAPWIMLPNSAKTELLYISSQTSALRPGLNQVLSSKSLPEAQASNPGSQDLWFQDTMEIGYTQLPGSPPLHVVMEAQRPNASDDVAATLLAPDFGFISVGSPRQPGDEEDHWMDWMGNLEVSHPVPGHPLGRIYYGYSSRTTFHPTIVKFLEAQAVQKPFKINTEWLVIQHVDEVMNFIPDQQGKAKLFIASPAAANAVLGSGYDAGNQQIQGYIDDTIAIAKTELGLSDSDILLLPTFFEGSGSDWAPQWSSPSNSVYINGTLVIGDTNTPAEVKTDIEQKLSALDIDVAWVDDSEYNPWGGNVHCGTNTTKTPICEQFVDCLP
jgi:protein-arginine deiminase